IVNWEELSHYFESPDEVKLFLEGTLRAILDRQRPVELLLPNYVATWPLPDLWNQVTDYELDFERFDYRSCELTVLDENEQVRYLFVVFALRSLGLPIPCICGETRFSDSAQDFSAARLQVFSLEAFGHPRKLFTMVGASQSALAEVVRPHAD